MYERQIFKPVTLHSIRRILRFNFTSGTCIHHSIMYCNQMMKYKNTTLARESPPFRHFNLIFKSSDKFLSISHLSVPMIAIVHTLQSPAVAAIDVCSLHTNTPRVHVDWSSNGITHDTDISDAMSQTAKETIRAWTATFKHSKLVNVNNKLINGVLVIFEVNLI